MALLSHFICYILRNFKICHFVTDEIININSKNIGYRVKKGAVLAFKRKSMVVNDFVYKNLCEPLPKEQQILPQKKTFSQKHSFKIFRFNPIF